MVALIERSTWDKVKEDYELGKYKTLRELAERHGVSYQHLRNRSIDNGWKAQVMARTNKIQQVIEDKKVSLVESYLSSSFSRAKKYEKIIDESQKALSTTNDGTPLLDVDAIVAYSKAELNIHALAKSALRIVDSKQVDLTTGGQSLGQSLIQAISQMRENKDLPVITDQEIDRIVDVEIVEG